MESDRQDHPPAKVKSWLAANTESFITIRHDLHRHPELQFEEHRTAGIVARELASYGYAVTTGVAKTGVVGTLSRGHGRRAIALRADMDALPILETTGLPYASTAQGKMHACGHDGHTTSLLAAARCVADNANFSGTLHLIFQPAEEDISGAKLMVEEGLFKRFPVDGVFAMHNLPSFETGHVMTRSGPITTRADIVRVRVIGTGGHGALPHLTADPVVAAASIVMALQTTVSRNLDPIDVAVVTVGGISGGNTLGTVIPESVELTLGVRTVTASAAELMRKRIHDIINHQAASFGCRADIIYGEGIIYPAGINDSALTTFVQDLASRNGQTMSSIDLGGPFMFSEDFAFMQQAVPGCFFAMGNGQTKNLHDPGYDFNDALIPKAAAFWYQLVEQQLVAQ
jgi:hippurate hydrolase